MRRALILTLLVVIRSLCASPDDERLSQLLVGEWQGGRHAEQYMADGTWRFDPVDGTTHGTWRITGGRFLKTWAAGPSDSYEILTLDKKTFVVRGKDGIVFTHRRIARPLSQ